MLVRRIDDLPKGGRPANLDLQARLLAQLATASVAKCLERMDLASGKDPLAAIGVLPSRPEEDAPQWVGNYDRAAEARLRRACHDGVHKRVHSDGVVGQIVPVVPDSIRFVYEDDLLRITDVKRSTRNNWAKPPLSLVEDPADGRFRESNVLETIFVARIVVALKRLPDVRRAWVPARDEALAACANLEADGYLVALLEPRLLRLTLARSDAELGRAMRPFEAAVAVPLDRAVADAKADFWRFAINSHQAGDRRRRAARSQPAQTDLRH